MVFCPCWRRPRRRPTNAEALNYITVNKYASVILRACWDQDWQTVLRRLKTHRKDAFCMALNGRTALHLCTMPGANCPQDVIETVLAANPHAVIVSDKHKQGGTPLHFLCGSHHRDNAKLVELFIQSAITAEESYPDYYISAHRWSPLFMACRKAASAECLLLLVQSREHTVWIAPTTGGETSREGFGPYLSPLWELWKQVYHYFDGLDEATRLRLRQITFHFLETSTLPPLEEDERVAQAWLKVLILLAHHLPLDSTLVHLLSCLYSPMPSLLTIVCNLFPEYGRTRDGSGRLPLHSLLYKNPRYPDKHARGLANVLLKHFPEAVRVEDPATGFFPCFLAASQQAPLETIWKMLVDYPEALELERAKSETYTE